MKLNDFKNAILDAVSFFPSVVFPVKVYLSFVSAVHLKYLTLALPQIMISSPRKSTVLIHHANYQIRNTPYNDRKVNDLRRLSDILYPGGTLGKNSCMHAPVVVVRTCGHVVLDDIYVDDIYRHIRSCYCAATRDSTKIPVVSQCCEVLQNLSDKRI